MLQNIINSIVRGVLNQVNPRFSSIINEMNNIKNDVSVIKAISPSIRSDLDQLQGALAQLTQSNIQPQVTQEELESMVQEAINSMIGPQPLPPGNGPAPYSENLSLIGENGLIGEGGKTGLIGENGLIGTNG